ncbi:MAG TPA: PadR family transcriptional regulator [Longimicrobiales bacterium]|nr:PadR family transcriptional regulator [Longimicrobiales bacterium]
MTSDDRNPRDLLPLSPAVFHILLSLVDGERHGYAIMRDVEERTGGEVRLGPGTLYGAIKRLLEQGVVEELEERPASDAGDERRRYYRLTGFGRQVVVAEAERLERLVRQAQAKKLVPRVDTV